MGLYKIFFKQSAEKELRRISPPFLSKILDKILKLSIESRPPGCEMLRGEEGYFRLRQGDYRVIYHIDDSRCEIMIIKIGHRREVYD